MPRPRSVGVLVVTLIVGVLFATVISEVFAAFIDHSSVVYRVLIDSYAYEFGPVKLSLVMVGLTLGFSVNINLLTILAMMAAYYYWKYRTH